MKYALIIVLFVISGCANFSGAQKLTADKGGEIADQSLITGIFLTCNGSSNGAVWRKFNTTEEYNTWNTFCKMASGKVSNIVTEK